jgi:hypothetical protein
MSETAEPVRYDPYVEANFVTSGVDIGRTQNTDTIQEAAQKINEYDSQFLDQKPFLKDLEVQRSLAKNAIFGEGGYDMNELVASGAMGRTTGIEVDEAVQAATYRAHSAVKSYHKLKIDTDRHNTVLLAQARREGFKS